MRTVMTIDNLDIEHGILLGKVDKFCYLDAGMEDETEQWLQKLELHWQYSMNTHVNWERIFNKIER